MRRDALIAAAKQRLAAEQSHPPATARPRVESYANLNAIQDQSRKIAALSDLGIFDTIDDATRNALDLCNHPAIVNARRIQEQVAAVMKFINDPAFAQTRALQETFADRAFRQHRAAMAGLGL